MTNSNNSPTIAATTVCPHCQGTVGADAQAVACPICSTPHHEACWKARGGCAEASCEIYAAPAAQVAAALTRERPAVAGATAPRRGKLALWIVLGILAGMVLGGALAYFVFHVPITRIILIAVVVAALGFDFVNGMNDSGNAIATVISTRALTPLAALLMAAVLNFVGAVVLEGVAKNIANNIVDAHTFQVTPMMVLCGLLGAIGWAYLMARIGMPISMSHALIGGLVGVFIAAGAKASLKLGFIGHIAMWMMLAPLIGFVFGWLLMVAIMWIFRNCAPHKVQRSFRLWQILSSACMAFMHGANDAQKAMGIITLALIAESGTVTHDTHIPLWVKIACATVIALGTAFGGKRVISTLGHKIIKLTPVHGFAAETVASGTILLATVMTVPISTTHVISSSILGVGASKRLSAVRWGVATNIVMAWIFTIPTCGMAAGALYALVRVLGLDPGV